MKGPAIITRCAPFDLVKVQKRLVHGRHKKRSNQHIVGFVSVPYACYATTNLWWLEKLCVFSLPIIPGILYSYFSKALCVSLEWL